jgi:hypothetical protein
MKDKENMEALELLDLLGGWRSKGSLVYRLRELGVSWSMIDSVCASGASLAGRWAKRHGKVWPIN